MFSKRSNLPPTSSPWGKEVEDKIAALERDNALLRGTVTSMAAIVRALPVPVAGPVQTYGSTALSVSAATGASYVNVAPSGSPTVFGSLDPHAQGFLITESGTYVVSANVTFGSTSATGNRAARITRAGSPVFMELTSASSGNSTSSNLGGVMQAEVGDIIAVEAWQTSGSTITISGLLSLSKHQ